MKWKWRILIGVAVAATFVANRVEHLVRVARIRQDAQDRDVPVVNASYNDAGHRTIQIDEQSLGGRGYLYFSALESWHYSRESPAPPPSAVTEANARQVKIMGFMYPLGDPDNLTTFAVLRSTQTCCYGPRPQFNQYVFVEMPKPVRFERLAPVVVEGRFFVDPEPDDGFIYRMEGGSVRPAVNNDQPPTAEDFARESNLPIFDFAPLEAAKAAADKQAAISQFASDEDGKPKVVSGFVVGKTDDSPPRYLIGKYPWDGKSVGTIPGPYNVVFVAPKSAVDVPPAWWQEAVFKGTVHVTADPSQRSRSGIVSLQDAVLAVGPDSRGLLVDDGPRLSQSFEVMLFSGYAAFLALGFFSGKRRDDGPAPAGPEAQARRAAGARGGNR